MLNETITELYCNNGIVKEINVNTNKPKTILNQLTEAGIKYTWETVRDERIDNQQSVIEVRIYLPGNILYGRFVYKTADASNAHLYAINEAIKTIVPIQVQENVEQLTNHSEQSVPIATSTQQNATPLSQEEILDMVQKQNNSKITTAEQFEKDPREEVPFEDLDMDLNELDKLLSGTSSNNKVYESDKPVQQSQPVSHGFTQEQINAINEFKQRLNITNDIMLGNYINSWDNKLSKKEDLTPANIDSFIEWAHSVGKAPC